MTSAGNVRDWCTTIDQVLRRINPQKHCSADSDALWLPVCSGYVLGRRASAIPHAARDKPWSNLCVPVTRRAAVFSTHCSLIVSNVYRWSGRNGVTFGCYIWYSEEGPGRAAAPPSSLLTVPNVTASVPTSYYSMWHYNFLCPLEG